MIRNSRKSMDLSPHVERTEKGGNLLCLGFTSTARRNCKAIFQP